MKDCLLQNKDEGLVEPSDLASIIRRLQNGDNARWHILLATGFIVMRFVGPFCVLSVSDSGNGEKKMNETIGQRIKECRKKMGMTQEKLAELSYIPKSTLSAYERDLVDIKMGTIKELEKIFHTTAGYLIDGEKVEFDEDIMQVVMMLQEMPEELRKVAMEQVKVLVGEGRCGDR